MSITYKEYKYLYETHLHTCCASACARNNGLEMAKAAKEYGYAGIFVTEHNWGGNTCTDRSLPWDEWVSQFSKGYRQALAYGKENDFDVFFGYEAGFDATEFLVYGLSPEWMMKHPEIRTATIKEHYQIVHEAGGFVVHAHPFREECYIPEIRLFPRFVDAVEGVNATHSSHKSKSHNDPAFDKRAIEYAKEHHLPMTAGSDVHSIDLFGGGVLFKQRLTSPEQYKEVILAGDYMLTNGDSIYDRFGNVIEQRS